MAEGSELTDAGEQLNITIEAHTSVQSTSTTDEDQKMLFKAGLLTSLVAIGGILNPPITGSINKAHTLLSMTFSLAISLNLAIGILQILLSKVLQRVPRLIFVAKKLTEVALAFMRITLGFGTSLVLMGASSYGGFFALVCTLRCLSFYTIHVANPGQTTTFRCKIDSVVFQTRRNGLMQCFQNL